MKSLLTRSLFVAFVLLTFGSSGFSADEKKENLVKDPKIKAWANRTSLLSRMSKVYSSGQISEDLKKVIKKRYQGKVKKFLDARYPKKVDLKDKKRSYLVVFLNLRDIKTIEILNEIQRNYIATTTVVAISQPLVARNRKPGEKIKYMADGDTEIEPVDPTFAKRNKEAFVLMFKTQEKKPNFLVAFDENRNVEGGKAYPRYSTLHNNHATRMRYEQTLVFVSDKNSEIIWMGSPVNASYYVKEADALKGGWSKFKGSMKIVPEIKKYFALLTNPKYADLAKKKGDDFYEALSHNPEMLVAFIDKMLNQDIFKRKDMAMTLKAVIRLKALLGEGHPLVNQSFQLYYKVNGELDKAKAVSKLNATDFKAYQKAALSFSNTYWPYVQSAKVDLSEEQARALEKSLHDGFMVDKQSYAAVVYKMMMGGSRLYSNTHFMAFVELCYSSSMVAIKGRALEENDHIIYAAYSIYHYRQKKWEVSHELMSKAVKCSEMGDDAKLKLNYSSFLKKLAKKAGK
jgi:hypothetical protein